MKNIYNSSVKNVSNQEVVCEVREEKMQHHEPCLKTRTERRSFRLRGAKLYSKVKTNGSVMCDCT